MIERTRRSVQTRFRSLRISFGRLRSTRFSAAIVRPMTVCRGVRVRSNVSSMMLRARARSDISELLGGFSEIMGGFPAMDDIAGCRCLERTELTLKRRIAELAGTAM